ncbi:hypothetical protein [Actomonas aquatica]|uniref:Uncharacterized protein n=1 Tax=Actomonas aquatica TaxID=2866162 RepID=A0ABZ1C9S8_9BACT|nr:hypothetical protein [Opitutus sp. WL0086]WRQ88130.1 hypothetical protein K1X11_001840 [Opitutus sp. WL0086]
MKAASFPAHIALVSRSLGLALLGQISLFAALPQTLEDAETFARNLIEQRLYNDLSVVGRDNLAKMKVQRNESQTSTTFFLPRSTWMEPDYIVEVVMNPVNAPLSRGHLRAHQPLQEHRFTDYKDESDYATQSETYERLFPGLGLESACVALSVEKRHADAFAKIDHLRIAWLPPDQAQFGLVISLRNLRLNLPQNGNIGADFFHTSLDREITPILLAIARAADDAGFIRPAQLSATETFAKAVQDTWLKTRVRDAFLQPTVPPRLLTVAAYRASAPAAKASVPPPSSPPSPPPATPPAAPPSPPTPPPPADGRFVRLEPTEVAQLAVQHRLITIVPEPTPAITLNLPEQLASPPAGPAPAFEKSTLLGLLFDPDLRLMLTKEQAGFSATVFVHAKGDWAAVVAETEDGFHLPVITLKQSFPNACAAFLKLNQPRAEHRRLEFKFSPVRLAVLRTLFELQESTRLLAGQDTADLAAYPTEEIMTVFASPRMLRFIDVLPEPAQWEVQTLAGNSMLLSIELTSLQQRGLLRRQLLNGTPRYRLTADGLAVSRDLFAPGRRLSVTRIPARLIATTPSVHLTNLAAFATNHTALIRHLPDGHVLYRRAPWRGGASIWDLFAGLTEPET